MAKWENRERKVRNRRAFSKQGKALKNINGSASDATKRRIKRLQREHRKNQDIWYDDFIDEDEVSV